MKASGLQKSQFPKSLINWEKLDKPRSAFQNLNFKYMDKFIYLKLIWIKLRKIRWGTHIKKERSHFKLNVNDSDIHKILRIYQQGTIKTFFPTYFSTPKYSVKFCG